jgi:hypothetical protein
VKIRSGFISNSSTSSFCILGYETTAKELAEVFCIVYDEENDEINNMIEMTAAKEGFNVAISCDEWAYVGVDIEGLDINSILEIGIQPTDNNKLAILREKFQRNKEPVVCTGEVDC